MHPEDRAAHDELVSELLACDDDRVIAIKLRIRSKSGAWEWIACNRRPYERDAKGRVISEIGAVQIITRLVETNAALRDSEARYRTIFEQAADAISAYLPHRKRPKNLDGLKKNLRHRDGRWFWHWDPAFLKPTNDDPFVRVEQLEQAAVELTIPILLIRGKLSDVVSPEGVQEFLAKVPAAEFVELSDAGHTAAGDDNDAFTDAVVQFVRQ